MSQFQIPAAFLDLHDSGRLDLWGAPYDELTEEEREKILATRQFLTLWWSSVEWDRSPNEILSFEPDEMIRPGLIPFAGNGYGDAYCWYPTWQQGSEPPVVYYSHDVEESELFAESFGEFLCRCLLQSFANPEETDEDPAHTEKLWQAHVEIIKPYLDASQQELLLGVGADLSAEACEAADDEIAERLGSRVLIGIPPELEHQTNKAGIQKVVTYYRELVEAEGRADFAPKLQEALAALAAR